MTLPFGRNYFSKSVGKKKKLSDLPAAHVNTSPQLQSLYEPIIPLSLRGLLSRKILKKNTRLSFVFPPPSCRLPQYGPCTLPPPHLVLPDAVVLDPTRKPQYTISVLQLAIVLFMQTQGRCLQPGFEPPYLGEHSRDCSKTSGSGLS